MAVDLQVLEHCEATADQRDEHQDHGEERQLVAVVDHQLAGDPVALVVLVDLAVGSRRVLQGLPERVVDRQQRGLVVFEVAEDDFWVQQHWAVEHLQPYKVGEQSLDDPSDAQATASRENREHPGSERQSSSDR